MAKKIESTKTTKVVLEQETPMDKSQDVTKKHGVFQGFLEFLNQYSVLGLAIGLVIGNSSQNLVKAIVDGLISPTLTLFIKIFFPALQSLESIKPSLNGVDFAIGALIQTSIVFVIQLFLIYFIVTVILKRSDILEGKKKK